jgi:hypothetical protein
MVHGELTQKNIKAGRDNIVNNVDQQTIFEAGAQQVVVKHMGVSPISAWMERLADEIRRDVRVQDFVATLQFYQEHHSHDGIDGLEPKLKHAKRAAQVSKAIRKKELFVRLLDEFSMFDSAQHIFAYVLSKMDTDFEAYVLPNLGKVTDGEIDIIINERLITPATHEATEGAFSLNAAVTSGMVYWLAEQCYIRWHP